MRSLLSALVLVLLAWGFVHNTRIAINNQRYGPPGAEHPWDWWAEGCLALVLGAVLALTRPSPRRWRKTIRHTGEKGAGRARRRRRLRVQ